MGTSRISNFVIFSILGIAIILAIAAAVVLYVDGPKDEIKFGTTLVLGAGTLLILLFLMSIGFAQMGLHNREESLGLPAGSIRAVIALMLLLVFVGVSIATFNAFNAPAQHVLQGVSRNQLSHIIENGGQLLTAELAQGGREYSEVIVQYSPADSAVRIGEQVITLLGTLLTAIASFYFGTRTTSDLTKTSGDTSALGKNDEGSLVGSRRAQEPNEAIPVEPTESQSIDRNQDPQDDDTNSPASDANQR